MLQAHQMGIYIQQPIMVQAEPQIKQVYGTTSCLTLQQAANQNNSPYIKTRMESEVMSQTG
jgi:hypothetical protein